MYLVTVLWNSNNCSGCAVGEPPAFCDGMVLMASSNHLDNS